MKRVKPDAITDTYSLMNVKILQNSMRLTIQISQISDEHIHICYKEIHFTM